MIVISSCLIGENCRYNGGNNLIEALLKLKHEAISVCPEMLGGLSCPRKMCEIKNGKVIDIDQQDYTEEFYEGARKALELCLKNKVKLAILKANSPSCGCNKIYDGTFTHTLIEGKGIFVRMLEENGIKCIDEEDYLNGCI